MRKVFSDERLQKAYKDKIKQLQCEGKTPSSFETIVDGKQLKLNLNNDVREQYKEVLLAERFIIQDQLNLSSEDLFEIRMKLLECARKNMLFDGKEIKDVRELPFDMIDTIILFYVTELLLPLYQSSSMKVSKRFEENLTPFIKE